jgi:Uri superfamily endonuclease
MDYKNSKIYAIRSNQTDKIYIGSTINELSKRLSRHKKDFKNWKNGKQNYVTSYELIKYDDVYIELLEKYPCKNRMELCRREGKLIKSMDCVNKCVAGRTQKE